MKNKKVVRTLTAMALIAAMAAPMTAFAAITPGDKSTVSGGDVSTEQTGETTVEFEAEAMYVVTIPATIDLTEVDSTAIYSGSGSITANRVHLNEGKKLQVTLKSDSNFELTAGGNTLTYTAAKDDGFTQTIANEGVVGYFEANAGTMTEDASLPIYFKTTDELKFAGNYSDTVIFSFKEVDI